MIAKQLKPEAMKKITLALVLLMSFVLGFGQCPSFDIELSTQAQIDNFAANYPNCYEPTHEIRINGSLSTISNLNGLYKLTDASSLFIFNTQINNLYGLHNLENADHIALWGNHNLTDLSGFSSIQSIGSIELFINNSIASLGGMVNIQSIDNLNLFSNSNLSDISDLSFIESMNSLTIGGNSINSLNGLENLKTVTGDLNLTNEQLTNFTELENLDFIGGSLYVAYFDDLNDLTAFSNIETLEDLYILECPNLSDLTGLSKLHTVNGKFRIGFNSGLTTLAGVYDIESVGDLDIYENENLNSLKGFENIQEIKNRLFINNNPVLFSIDALKNVSTEEIDEVAIIVNHTLSVCSNELICTILLDPSVSKTFFDNAPGCSSENEVQISCNSWSLMNIALEEQVDIYPNPVSNYLTISLSEGILFKKAIIYSISNERIYESLEETIDLSMFPKGIYFVDIETNKGNVIQKIIKA